MCADCLNERAEYRNRQISLGLCAKCTSPRVGKRLCQKHTDSENLRLSKIPTTQTRVYKRAWALNNRPSCKPYRDSKRKALGKTSAKALRLRIAYYDGLCWICSKPYEAVDHVKPLSKGGSNWPANLRPICRDCNSRKASKWPFNRHSLEPK